MNKNDQSQVYTNYIEFFKTWSGLGFVDFTNLINILVSEITRSNEAKEISKILAMFSEINAEPFVRVTDSIEQLLNDADLYGVRNDALTIFGNIAIFLSNFDNRSLENGENHGSDNNQENDGNHKNSQNHENESDSGSENTTSAKNSLNMTDAEICKVVDLCCEACFRHLRDISSFCRTKALDVLEKLAQKSKLKLEVISEALKGANKKLLDDSVMVRKKALRLVNVLVRNNPVGDMFGTAEQFEEKIVETRVELKQKEQEAVLEENLENNSEIQALKFRLRFLILTQLFQTRIEESLEIITEVHLVSVNENDVKEALNVVSSCVQRHVTSAGAAIKSALPSIFSKNEDIRSLVAIIYSDCFMRATNQETFDVLIQFIKNLEFSETEAAKEVFRQIGKSKIYSVKIRELYAFCWENLEKTDDFRLLEKNLRIIEVFGNLDVDLEDGKEHTGKENTTGKSKKRTSLSKKVVSRRIDTALACLPEELKGGRSLRLVVSCIDVVLMLSESRQGKFEGFACFEEFVKLLIDGVCMNNKYWVPMMEKIVIMFFRLAEYPIVVSK